MGSFKSFEDGIKARIAKKKSKVFIRKDFADLGGYDQVGRALLIFTRQNKLAKLGYGIYAKTKTSQLTGKMIPVAPLPALAKEALRRLGVKTLLTRGEKDYLEGRSTQVPTRSLIGVNKFRLSHKIGYQNVSICYVCV